MDSFPFSTSSPLKKRLCKTAAAPAAEGEQCPKAARAGGCERPVTSRFRHGSKQDSDCLASRVS